MLFRFRFPIPNYENNGIFFQDLYLTSEHCPTVDDVVTILRRENQKEIVMSHEHPEWGPYLFCYGACLHAIEEIREGDSFPKLSGPNLVESNAFCETEFGTHPLTLTLLVPIPVEEK
jgi:hypothetical protein